MIPTKTDQLQYPSFPLSFALPASFSEVDLYEDPGQRARKLNEQLERTMPGLTGLQQAHMLLANQYMVERMITEGVVYAASFVGRSEREPTAVSSAQFTVMVRTGDGVARPLDMVLKALQNERADCAAQLVDLPIGRCLAVIEDDRFQTPVNSMGHPDNVLHHVRQIQVIVPFTGHNQLALFALGTECLWDWDDYVDMMAAIARTITWNEQPSGRIASALNG